MSSAGPDATTLNPVDNPADPTDAPADLQPVTDSTAALRAAVRYGAVGMVVLAVVGVILGAVFAGVPGVWGALVGAAVGGGFILFTGLGVLLTARLSATTAGAVLLGTWLLKMLLAIGVLAAIDNLTFYNRSTLAAVILAALVVVLGAETYGLLRQRTPYVETVER